MINRCLIFYLQTYKQTLNIYINMYKYKYDIIKLNLSFHFNHN